MKLILKCSYLILFLAGFLVLSTMELQADLPNFRVAAIVISKNCLEAFNPATQLESLKNPECPQVGQSQLIQVTLSNFSSMEQVVDLQIRIEVNGKRAASQPPLLRKMIPAQDEIRTLYNYKIPNFGGLYEVSVLVFDQNTKQEIARSESGIQRKFYVVTKKQALRLKQRAAAKVKAEEQKNIPEKLQFDPPDLKWEEIQIIPKHVLRGEPFKVRLGLTNIGGDLARKVEGEVVYYNTQLPRRHTPIATPRVEVLAPGETVSFEVEYLLPDSELLGDYQILATVDPKNQSKDRNRENNQKLSTAFTFSDIKLLLPLQEFAFEPKGLFFFQWDSIQYAEFKIQIGTAEEFDDPASYFELPQGDRWTSDKELVPLAGELPAMAVGLMKKFKKIRSFGGWLAVKPMVDKPFQM